MIFPSDPIEQKKQALIQHLVGRAGMAGGGRPVGTLQGRGFGSFVRSGADPLMHMLGMNQGEHFTGVNPGQLAAAAAMANAPGLAGGGPPGLGGGLPPAFQGGGGPPVDNFTHAAPSSQQMPSISPGEFYAPGGGAPPPSVQNAIGQTAYMSPLIQQLLQPQSAWLGGALGAYGGGVKTGFGWN